MANVKLKELRKLAEKVKSIQGEDIQQLVQDQMRDMGLDPNNIYQELEMSEVYVETHRDISSSNTNMQLHSHTFYELIYCRRSCGAEYLVGSERYRMQRGDIVIIPPGVSHRPLLPETMYEPYERYVLWISQEFLEGYASLISGVSRDMWQTVGVLRTGGTPWESLGELFRTGVVESEKQAEGWEAVVIGNTILLLTQIKRAKNEHTLSAMIAEKPVLLDRITGYIEDNYAAQFTIDMLAKKFYVSSSTISHLFKDKLGVSLYRYVTQRRLIAAKSLIQQGVLLEEVAIGVGFQDYSGFYRAFKQEYGISPRQYRNHYGI